MAASVGSLASLDHARRAGGVGLRHRLQAELDELAAALAERLRVAEDALDGLAAWRRAPPSADGARAGSARRRCRDRRRAAGDGCRRRGRRPSSRWGSWQGALRPPSPPAARPRTSGRRRLPCRGTPRGRRGANWRPARPDRRCASAAGLLVAVMWARGSLPRWRLNCWRPFYALTEGPPQAVTPRSPKPLPNQRRSKRRQLPRQGDIVRP